MCQKAALARHTHKRLAALAVAVGCGRLRLPVPLDWRQLGLCGSFKHADKLHALQMGQRCGALQRGSSCAAAACTAARQQLLDVLCWPFPERRSLLNLLLRPHDPCPEGLQTPQASRAVHGRVAGDSCAPVAPSSAPQPGLESNAGWPGAFGAAGSSRAVCRSVAPHPPPLAAAGPCAGDSSSSYSPQPMPAPPTVCCSRVPRACAWQRGALAGGARRPPTRAHAAVCSLHGKPALPAWLPSS